MTDSEASKKMFIEIVRSNFNLTNIKTLEDYYEQHKSEDVDNALLISCKLWESTIIERNLDVTESLAFDLSVMPIIPIEHPQYALMVVKLAQKYTDCAQHDKALLILDNYLNNNIVPIKNKLDPLNWLYKYYTGKPQNIFRNYKTVVCALAKEYAVPENNDDIESIFQAIIDYTYGALRRYEDLQRRISNLDLEEKIALLEKYIFEEHEGERRNAAKTMLKATLEFRN